MDSVLLNEYWIRSGKSKTHLAKKLDCTRPVIYKIFDNPSRCTYSQVDVLCKELEIEDENDKRQIFLP